MYCPYCGSELPDDAKFCNHCGKKIPNDKSDSPIETISSPKQQSVSYQSTSLPSKSNNNTTKTTIIVCVVLGVVLLCGIIGVIILFNTASNTSEPEFTIDVLSLESDDGYTWTAYVLVTNIDTRPIKCTLDYTFMDNHGKEIGHTTQNIGKIEKGGYKSSQSTIKSNKYVEESVVNVICEATAI